MITPESIERVREAADIVEIVGEHVKLKRAGGDFRGPCPFHGGKNPNFSVSPKRNAYHCFKCGVSGDAIGFVREHLGMDFVEAVRYVAARAGVDVQETRAARGPDERDPREPLWECTAAAVELFRTALWDDEEAAAARDYLASRGLAKGEADRFGLGYAPRDARWVERLRALGHDDARLMEVGLLVQREDGSPPRARFRGRLMFPIHDASGRVVGFGGRVLGEGEPKYLNSPQGTLFDKGRSLYGLSWAKHPIRKQERVLVVEGYFDAIRLALAGIEEAVAPLGTALTEGQAAILAKLTRNVFLLYDSDEAGLKATFRAGLELLRLGVSPRVVTLPNGEDPDTFVRAHGAERMEQVLAQGVDLLDRQIQLLERRGWFAELHKKRRAIDKLLPTVRACADPVTRDLYVSRVAEVSGVDRATVQREAEQEERRPGQRTLRIANDGDGGAPAVGTGDGTFGRGGARGRWRDDPPPRSRIEDADNGVTFVEPPRPRDGDRPFRRDFGDRRGFKKGRRTEDWESSKAIASVKPSARVLNAERLLVRAMIVERNLVEVVAERLEPADFHQPGLRLVFERLLATPSRPLDELTHELPAEVVRQVDVLLEFHDPDPHGTVAGTLRNMQKWELDAEKARLHQRSLQATTEEEKAALAKRIQELQRERQALSVTFSRVGPRLDL